MSPKLYKPKPAEVNFIHIPFEQFVYDKSEEETFKLVNSVTMHNMGFGYTCFASAFAFFISDTEVKTQNSQVLKAFENIKTEE